MDTTPLWQLALVAVFLWTGLGATWLIHLIRNAPMRPPERSAFDDRMDGRG